MDKLVEVQRSIESENGNIVLIIGVGDPGVSPGIARMYLDPDNTAPLLRASRIGK